MNIAKKIKVREKVNRVLDLRSRSGSGRDLRGSPKLWETAAGLDQGSVRASGTASLCGCDQPCCFKVIIVWKVSVSQW